MILHRLGPMKLGTAAKKEAVVGSNGLRAERKQIDEGTGNEKERT